MQLNEMRRPPTKLSFASKSKLGTQITLQHTGQISIRSRADFNLETHKRTLTVVAHSFPPSFACGQFGVSLRAITAKSARVWYQLWGHAGPSSSRTHPRAPQAGAAAMSVIHKPVALGCRIIVFLFALVWLLPLVVMMMTVVVVLTVLMLVVLSAETPPGLRCRAPPRGLDAT